MLNVVPLRRLLRTARTSGPDITDGVTSMLAESSSTRRIGALPALCQARQSPGFSPTTAFRPLPISLLISCEHVCEYTHICTTVQDAFGGFDGRTWRYSLREVSGLAINRGVPRNGRVRLVRRGT